MKLSADSLKVLKFWGGVAVIGLVGYFTYSHISASNYRQNADQQMAKCELEEIKTYPNGAEGYNHITYARLCMQAAGYKFEPLDPNCEKSLDIDSSMGQLNPSCWLGAVEDPCVGRQATIEPQASKCKAAGR